MGVVQYHLSSLEKSRSILSRRSGLYKRFYPALVFSEHEQEVLDILSQETERDLLIYLLHHPKSTHKELSEYAQLSPGTINWHMKRLILSGLVSMQREGQFVKYFVNAETDEIMNLVREYHPSTWANWVDRLANALGEVTSVNGINGKARASEARRIRENK